MTKRNPDKREQKRLKKIEDENQKKRYLAADFVQKGMSLRDAAKRIGMSHEFVKYWADRLLETKTIIAKVDGKDVSVKKRAFKRGFKNLLVTKKPGPKPGKHPKVDEIMEAVVKTKSDPKYSCYGAKKIGLISKVDASSTTVDKALKMAGFKPVTKPHARHNKRYCRKYPNEQWDIDFVQVGIDRFTGKRVEALSVIDDHSRKSFSSAVTTVATTEFVIGVLEELIKIFGKPRIIRSDHGCQWYSPSSGESKFDEWCESLGIRHDMASIRTPEENGKVERYHGSIRREVDLPAEGSVEEYHEILESYRLRYNTKRPHCALDWRTPHEVYYKTYEMSVELPA